MNQRLISPFVLALLVSAAAAVISACGGGEANAATRLPASDDDPDAATAAHVARLLDSIDASLRELPDVAETPPSSSERSVASNHARLGPFPGVMQTNLVANKSEFGAQLLEPELRNAWGIAIRPAGAGGHFWVGAAGDQPVDPVCRRRQRHAAVPGRAEGCRHRRPRDRRRVQSRQPVRHHAAARRTGAITAPTKFFFANADGTISAWTERARPGGGFDHPADSVTVVDGTRAPRSTFLGVTVTPAGDRMLAADFGAQAALRFYDGRSSRGAACTIRLPAGREPGGFEAFNVQTLGERVFAMYGRHVRAGHQARRRRGPPGRVRRPGPPDSPAGTDAAAELPLGRGDGAARTLASTRGCLLVGNFGDGTWSRSTRD